MMRYNSAARCVAEQWARALVLETGSGAPQETLQEDAGLDLGQLEQLEVFLRLLQEYILCVPWRVRKQDLRVAWLADLRHGLQQSFKRCRCIQQIAATRSISSTSTASSACGSPHTSGIARAFALRPFAAMFASMRATSSG